MICPDYLRPGDRVGLVAPARKVSPAEMAPAIRLLSDWGWEVVPGKNLFRNHHQYAGTDEERAMDLQTLLDDPDIRAIVCARGGYGTVRLIPLLDFTGFMRSPKWIVGYSDLTVLHQYLNNRLGVQSIHATMPVNIDGSEGREESLRSLKAALTGEKLHYVIRDPGPGRAGTTRGLLNGGNLSILYSLRGTPLDMVGGNRILFLEEVDEYLYHLDRMMMNLELGDVLKQVAGMITGQFSNMRDHEIPFGKSAEEILLEYAGRYRWPYTTNFPAGHEKKNLALYLGRECELKVEKNLTELIFL